MEQETSIHAHTIRQTNNNLAHTFRTFDILQSCNICLHKSFDTCISFYPSYTYKQLTQSIKNIYLKKYNYQMWTLGPSPYLKMHIICPFPGDIFYMIDIFPQCWCQVDKKKWLPKLILTTTSDTSLHHNKSRSWNKIYFSFVMQRILKIAINHNCNSFFLINVHMYQWIGSWLI